MPDYTLYPFDSAQRVPFKFDGRILFSSDGYELVHLNLLPGEGMDMHAQPMDVVFFVVEGHGELAIGDELFEIFASTTVHVNAGVLRAWTNTGTRPLKILVSKLLEQSPSSLKQNT